MSIENRARILALGSYNKLFETQIDSLMNMFEKKGNPSIRSTYKKAKTSKLLDMVSYMLRYRNEYDIIHIQAHSGLIVLVVWLSTLISRIYNKKTVVMYYGGGAHSFFKKFPRLIYLIFKRVDSVVVAGKYVQYAFSDLEISTSIIPHTLDTSRWKSRVRQAATSKVVWVRSFEKIYNPNVMIEITNALSKDIADLEVVMVGTGTMLDECKNKIKLLGLEKCLTIRSQINHHELAELYDWGDIFVNTSSIDNQPVTVLEAMSSGMVVVSSSVGGIPDIISNNKTGILVDSYSIDAFCKSIDRVVSDKSLANNISSNAINFISQTFSDNIIYSKWKEIYKGLDYILR